MRKHTFTRVAIGATALSMLFAGSAFTGSNTMTAVDGDVIGYGSTTVSGATVNSLAYNLNLAGDEISSVTLTLAGDTTTSAVSIAFNTGASSSCGTGTSDATSTAAATKTTYTCNGASFPQSTSGLTKTAVVVN